MVSDNTYTWIIIIILGLGLGLQSSVFNLRFWITYKSQLQYSDISSVLDFLEFGFDNGLRLGSTTTTTINWRANGFWFRRTTSLGCVRILSGTLVFWARWMGNWLNQHQRREEREKKKRKNQKLRQKWLWVDRIQQWAAFWGFIDRHKTAGLVLELPHKGSSHFVTFPIGRWHVSLAFTSASSSLFFFLSFSFFLFFSDLVTIL